MARKVETKTKRTQASAAAFVRSIEDPKRRADCQLLLKMFERIAKAKARMWGAAIVGFGDYTYRRASGAEGAWFLTGFSPRKQDLTIYIMPGFDSYTDLLSRLGKHKTGKSCLYLKSLSDVDLKVLEQLVQKSIASLRAR